MDSVLLAESKYHNPVLDLEDAEKKKIVSNRVVKSDPNIKTVDQYYI